MNKQTRAHANAREDTTELKRVVEECMVLRDDPYMDARPEYTKIVTAYAQSVAEEAVRVERFQIINELTVAGLVYPNNSAVALKSILTAQELKSLAPLPDKEMMNKTTPLPSVEEYKKSGDYTEC